MFGQSDSSDDYQPYGYLGRIPLYLTTILVILYVACMVALVLGRAGTVMKAPVVVVMKSRARARAHTPTAEAAGPSAVAASPRMP